MSIPPAPLPPTPAPPSLASRRLLQGLLAVAVLFLLKAAQELMVPLVVAVVLTFVLAGPVRALRRRGIPEFVGAGLLVAALLGGTGLLVTALAGPAAQWWERAPSVVHTLMLQFDRLRAAIPLIAPPQRPASTRPNAPPPADPVKDKLASEGVTLTRVVVGGLLGFSVKAAATVILLYFLLASEHWLLLRTVEAIPRRRTRALVLAGVRSAQQEIGRFLGALSLINLGVGVATGVAVGLIGLPNPVLWGALAGLLNFIPFLGSLLATVLLLVAGLLSFEASLWALAPPLAYVVIHALEANLVTPLFVGRRLTLSPIAVFLSVMFWTWLWGVAGAVLAVPLLVGLRSVCKRNRRLRLLCVYLEGSSRALPTLASLLRAKRRLPRAGAL